jgi:hypothetical protein
MFPTSMPRAGSAYPQMRMLARPSASGVSADTAIGGFGWLTKVVVAACQADGVL